MPSTAPPNPGIANGLRSETGGQPRMAVRGYAGVFVLQRYRIEIQCRSTRHLRAEGGRFTMGGRRLRAGGGTAIKRTRGVTEFTVESRRGAVSRERSVSPPRSSNRTCGFPASGFPTGFMTGSRHGAAPSQMPQSRHTKVAEHRLHTERPECCAEASCDAGQGSYARGHTDGPRSRGP